MASKREIKKRIVTEYKKLSEDIGSYINLSKEDGIEKAKELVAEAKIAQQNFGREINEAVEKGNEFYTDLINRAVTDIDEKYIRLKDLIAKK